MTEFAAIDVSGAILGFYSSLLGAPPAGAVQFTDAQYAQRLAAPDSYIWSASVNGLVAAPAPPLQPDTSHIKGW